MADLRQISFSIEIKNIADEMIQRFGFSESLAAIKFGFAYAIKNYPNEIPEENDRNSDALSRGLDYSVASFSDKEITTIIEVLYPKKEEPYRFLREASIFGLRKIKSLMDANPNLEITDLM